MYYNLKFLFEQFYLYPINISLKNEHNTLSRCRNKCRKLGNWKIVYKYQG